MTGHSSASRADNAAHLTFSTDPPGLNLAFRFLGHSGTGERIARLHMLDRVAAPIAV